MPVKKKLFSFMPADMNTLRTKQITSLVTQEFGAAVATDHGRLL